MKRPTTHIQAALCWLSLVTLLGWASQTRAASKKGDAQGLPDVAPDRVRIYVIRETQQGFAMPVSEGERPIGEVGPNCALVWERGPGGVTIRNGAQLPDLHLKIIGMKGRFRVLSKLPGGVGMRQEAPQNTFEFAISSGSTKFRPHDERLKMLMEVVNEPDLERAIFRVGSTPEVVVHSSAQVLDQLAAYGPSIQEFNGSFTSPGAAFSFHAEGGRTYYVGINFKNGWRKRTLELHLLSEEAGKALLSQATRIDFGDKLMDEFLRAERKQ